MYNEETDLIINLEDGTEMLCEILFTFESAEYDKSYVLYTPKDGESEMVYASSYQEIESGIGELEEVKTDGEWDMIEEILATFQDDE